ncbi:hypothetical protein REPUB_Repub08aG0007600 [Reevesia pubescens]
MAMDAASDTNNLKLELHLVETGQKLIHPPTLSADHLLPLLDQVENCLSRVDQKPSKSMQNALSVLMKALVAKPLFRHSNEDVKVAVASCICELTRITAPNTPYDDPQMKEVFKLIVSSLKNLSHKSSRSYIKRTSILGNVAMLRLCLVMLDLDCDALIIKMFQHFVNAMRDYHPKNVFSYMEMIMTQVLKESENISMELLFPILLIVKRDNKEVLPIARKLVARVLASSASKLKPYLMQAVENSGFSLCHYSIIVASICQEASGTVEQNVATTSDHKEDKEIPKESTKQVDLANGESLKLVRANIVVQIREDDLLADSNFLKRREHDHLADKPKNVDSSNIAEADDLGTEKVVNSKCKSDAKNRLTKSKLESIEPYKNPYIYKKEVETVPDHRKDSKDIPGSLHEYLSIDGTVSLQNLKGTGILPSNLEPTEPSENLYTCMKEVEILPDHRKDSNDVSGASHEDLPIDGAVSLENRKETGIRPSLESAEPSEVFYTCETEVETLSSDKRESKYAHDSLHKDLPIDGVVSLVNDKETVIESSSPKAKKDEPTDLTNSIPSGSVPDAQPQSQGSMIKETTPVVDNAFRKASEGTSDSEAKQTKCSGKKVAATISKEDRTDSKYAPLSLHEDLSIGGAVSLANDKEMVIQPSSHKARKDELTDLTSSIPSGSVPDAQSQTLDSMIKETTPVVDNAFRKASEGTSNSEAKQTKCSREKVATMISKEDKTHAEIDETEKENGTATPSKTRSFKQSLNKLGGGIRNGDRLSSKQLKVKKKRAQIKCISEKDGTKSSTRNDNKASVSIEYGENPVDLKVKVFWPKDQISYKGGVDSFGAVTKRNKVFYNCDYEEILTIKRERWKLAGDDARLHKGEAAGYASPDDLSEMGQMSASQDKVQSVEPSNLQVPEVEGTVNANLLVHINGQPKKRKSVFSRAYAPKKRLCYNAVEKSKNTLDDISSAFKFKTTQRESSNKTTLYQKCLEELQDLEGLDDTEFVKAVNFLKDDKNAIAFTTIKGPRRLVWLRSLWLAL